MDTLEDLLNGPEPEQTPAPEALVETPEPQLAEQPSTPRDELGRFVPKGETETPAPEPEAAPPAAKEETHVPVKAQIEERRKRQEAEARIAALEERLASLTQPQQPQYEEPSYLPDPYQDPEGYARFIMQQAVAAAEQRLAPQVNSTRADILVEMAKAKYADYDAVESSYRDLIAQNPMLHTEVMRQPNPVEYAYQTTKKHLEFQQRGATNVDELKAQLRAELLAELKTPAAPQAIPTSLADHQSARASSAAPNGGPPTLDSILGRS